MGRKRIPKNQRREVISISLKPATIDLIDSSISSSQSRSVFVENILLKYLKSVKNIAEIPTVIRDFWDCSKCDLEYSKLQPHNGQMLCRNCNTFLEITDSINEVI